MARGRDQQFPGLCVGYNQDGADCSTIWQPGDANAVNINPAIQAALVPTDTCSSRAFAVNNAGQIVGYYQPGMDSNYHAYLYNSATNIVDLGSLGGSNDIGTNPLAINSDGSVVGYSPATNGAQHAFLWTATTDNGTTGSMQDLNNMLLNAGAIPSGDYLYEATGINSAGSICGYLSNASQTQYQAFALIATLPGDANLDGKVDINDLTIVLAHYNQSGMTWQQGDFVGDGTVDINDLTIVLAHYGQSSGSSAAGMAAVPEPAGLAMLAAAFLAAAGVIARRRQ